jgi:hypothetical protein
MVDIPNYDRITPSIYILRRGMYKCSYDSTCGREMALSAYSEQLRRSSWYETAIFDPKISKHMKANLDAIDCIIENSNQVKVYK